MLEIIGVGSGIASLCVVTYFAGRAIGRRSNGYVTQDKCDANIERLTKSISDGKKDLYDKVNEVAETTSFIKGKLDKE